MLRPVYAIFVALICVINPYDRYTLRGWGDLLMQNRDIVFTVREWKGEYTTDVNGKAATAFQSDVWIVRADGSRLRRVTTLGKGTGNGQWSPDGRFIYFQSDVTGDCEIYRCQPDGTRVMNLTRSPDTDDYGFHLSPEGKRIVYVGLPKGQPARVKLMEADGTNQRDVASAAYSYMGRFTPEGLSLVYVSLRPNYGVYRCDLDGANERCLLRADGVDCHNPVPSPDGRYVICFRRQGGVSDLWRVGVEGSDPLQLTHGNTHESTNLGPKDEHGSSDPPDWSPDGEHLAFATGEPSQIWIMNAEGKDLRQLCRRPTPCGNARWSPDGKQIAFVSWVDDRPQLFVVPAVGGEPRQITRLPGAVMWPMWKRK